MKNLLILLCVFTFASCGIKNKIWNSSGGKLGVPKQPTHQISSDDSTNTPVTKVNLSSVQSQPPVLNKPSLQTKSSDLKWYYALPFLGVGILALLVYRIKQQNLKSL